MANVEALVEGPRARGAFVLRLELDGDWTIEVADESMLTVMAVPAGDCVVSTASGEATARQGNAVVVRGPGPFAVASEPGRAADFIIPPDQTCVDVHGNRLVESMSRGIRTWGTTVRGEDRILVGTYANPLEVGRLSAQLLPELMVERTDASAQAFSELLAEQAGYGSPASFSTAFKQEYGQSPRDWRLQRGGKT